MNKQKGEISMTASVVITVLLVALIVYAIFSKKAQAPDQNLNSENSTQISKITEIEAETKLPENVLTTSKNKSMEQIAKNGDVLAMNYTGRLADGTVFDSNVDPKFQHVEPFIFTLGAGMVIKGWDEGLVGMKVGEKKTLTITPDKGYGPRAVGPIPPNSTLVFDVELLAIKK